MVHIISANEVYSVEVVAKLRWWDGSTIMWQWSLGIIMQSNVKCQE